MSQNFLWHNSTKTDIVIIGSLHIVKHILPICPPICWNVTSVVKNFAAGFGSSEQQTTKIVLSCFFIVLEIFSKYSPFYLPKTQTILHAFRTREVTDHLQSKPWSYRTHCLRKSGQQNQWPPLKTEFFHRPFLKYFLFHCAGDNVDGYIFFICSLLHWNWLFWFKVVALGEAHCDNYYYYL